MLRSLLAASLLALILAAPAPAADFAQRFGVNDSGDITLIGNALLTCPDSSACTTAKSGTGKNNDFVMTHVNTDGDGTTFNHSSATLALPAESTVLFAGLYWGARTEAGTSGADAPDAGAKRTVKFAVPGGAYANVTGLAAAEQTIDGSAYQEFADVTAAVKAAGSGEYKVANVQAATGQDRYAGWSLIVAYRNPNDAPRNLSVFDGLEVVKADDPTATINVSGFTTAPDGPVKTTLGAVAYEGDNGLTGDGMTLEGTPLSNAVNPATDFFNSSVSVKGTRVTSGRTPNQANHLGLDVDLFDANGLLGNAVTDATFTVNTASSGGETIYPGVLTFASELLAAKIRPATTVTDTTGGVVEPGDVLEYESVATNTGNADATELTLRANIPPGTELVEDSIHIVSGPGTGGPLTPALDTDRAVYDGEGRTLNVRLGDGATPSLGGGLDKGATTRVRWRVRVLAPPDGTALPTDVNAAYGTATTTDHYTTSGSGGGGITVVGPDLALDLSRTGTLGRGQSATYTVQLSNVGSIAHKGLTRVTDELPAGLDVDGAPAGDGWDCSVSGRLVTCDRSDDLGVGASIPSIGIPVKVRQDAASTNIVNAATVSGASDGLHGNDSDADDGGLPFSQTALSIALDADPATVAPGATTTLTATVTNGGPSDAAGVQVALPVPTGFELVSTSGGTCAAGTCAVGTVEAGDEAIVTYVVRALTTGAGTSPTATASVTTATTDTTTGDDSASTGLTISEQRRVKVSQTIDPDAPIAGEPVTLTVKVANDGPSTATGVTLTEPLPSVLRTPTVTADADCALTSGTLTCDLPPLAAGDEETITIEGAVASSATGQTLSATASIDPVPGDVTTSDDSATVSRTVGGTAALSVALDASPTSLKPSETTTLTATVTNGGPADAAGVDVDVPVPTGFELVSADDDLDTIESGDSDAATYVVRALDAAAGTTPAATATLTAATTDSTTGDDTDSVTLTVAHVRRVSVAQTVDPATPTAGSPVTLTVTVANAGPSTATGVTLTEPLPSALTGPAVDSDDGDCAIAAGEVACDLDDLPAGADAVVEITGRVAASATGASLEATATIDPVADDVTTSDDSATVTRTVTGDPALKVTTESAPPTLRAGERGEWTFRAATTGPSDAAGVTLRIPLPPHVTVVDKPAGCSVEAGELVCALGTIATGEHADVKVVLALAPSAPATPLVLAPGLDGEPADPSAQATTPVTREANLGVTQKPVTGELVAGTPATLTSVVRNAGPSHATHVVITQPIPAGLEGATATLDGATGTCTTGAGVITCVVDQLPDGAAVTITTKGRVGRDAAGTPLVAKVSAGAAEGDPDPADDVDDTSATPVAVNDLSVVAFAPVGVVKAGQTAEVTLIAKNDGPSSATQVVITTTIPSAAEVVDLDPRCSLAGRVVTCTIGGLDVGQEAPVVLKVKAIRAFDGALLGGSSSVKGAGRDLAPANDSLASLSEVELPKCKSRRRFPIRLRIPHRSQLKSVRVNVGGKAVKVRVGKRQTAIVDLRGRPASRVVVRIVAVTKAGRTLAGTRAYQTCTVKKPLKKAPRI